MIYLIHDDEDVSVCRVLKLLNEKGVAFRSMTGSDLINPVKSICINNNHLDLEFDNGDLYSQIDVFWFRRGYFKFQYIHNLFVDIPPLKRQVDRHLEEETNTLLGFVNHIIQKKSIGNQLNYNQNKLVALEAAAEVGFFIPETYVSKGQRLKEIIDESDNELITKNIQDIIVLNHSNNTFTHKTVSVDDLEINEEFGYSLLQNRIKALYEFRVFVFLEKIYSIVCVNLNIEGVDEVDIRRRGGNKYTVGHIPQQIKDKIFDLMRRLNLQTASLDFLIDQTGNWYFLEANPVGQFDMHRTYGHFNLYEDIVTSLIEYGKAKKDNSKF
jgi:hypothetical protein